MQTVSDYNYQTGEHLPQSTKEEGAVPFLYNTRNISFQAEHMLKEARSIFSGQCLMLAIFLLTGQSVHSLFAPGRVPPGSFEYDGLNR